MPSVLSRHAVEMIIRGLTLIALITGPLWPALTVHVVRAAPPPAGAPLPLAVNLTPVVEGIDAPLDPVEVGTQVTASATFTDTETSDTHTAVWDWGDGNSSAGMVSEANSAGSVGGSHTYTIPGVYSLHLTLIDSSGNSAAGQFNYVVVYDPEGGFVTGGGWIDSPLGAYPADPGLTGKANFGFVSKYQKGKSTPSGNTQFQFKVANLNFKSDSYDWLVVAGHKAQFKGSGTINNSGSYGFMLTAIDEALTPSTEVDLFRIKIWDKSNGDSVVYDNQLGAADNSDPTTAIGGGSIVIHNSTPAPTPTPTPVPDPSADFTAVPLNGTAPLDVTFTNSSTNASLYWWDFGDGTTSTTENPSHTYSVAGVYTVTLQAGNGTVTDTLTRPTYIEVAAPPSPQAGFTASPLNGPAPLQVTFTNSSTDVSSYLWDFGDGSAASSEVNPLHTYTSAGVYTVTLSASDGVVTDTLVRTEYITVSEAVVPQAGFSGSPLSGTTPLTVTFTNSSTNASSYLWEFGDGATSNDPAPEHTYMAAGVYTVTLSASDGVVTDTLVRAEYVTVSEAVVPQADFSGTPLSGTAPLTVTFTNSSTNASSYLWDFGDGATSTEANPVHSYTTAGIYTVTLSAGDGVVTDTLTRPEYITVVEPVVADFSAFPRSGPIPLTVQFLDNSTNATTYLWNFGDGPSTGSGQAATSLDSSPVHTYTVAGVYTVTLTAGDGLTTDTITKTDYITATPSVVADFTATPLTGTVPLTVTFTNSSIGASHFIWDFGDGTISNLQSPISVTHTYTQTGVYTVTLQAGDGAITDTLTRTHYITATEPVVANFSAFPLSGSLPLLVQFLDNSTGPITNHLWDFGDGTFGSSLPSPTHTYTQTGVYTVSLNVTGPGGSDTLTKTNYITVTGVISRDWQLITTTISPPAIGEHAMAYDPDRNTVVLYGGNAIGWPYETTTWEFDDTDWLSITTGPNARYGAQMGYLPGEGVVLFGGSDASDTALNETWVYTDATWSQLPLTSPVSRTYHSLAINTISNTLYLFGGNDQITYFNDLWKYKNGAWTELPSAVGSSPSPRTLAALTYIPANDQEPLITDKLLLFGGRTVTGALLADLWEFDLSTATWTLLDGGEGSGPPPRMAHSLTYDPDTGNAVLVGGVAADGETRLDDTWHYDNGWTEANPATTLPPRAYHQAVFTPNGIVLVSNEEVWRYE